MVSWGNGYRQDCQHLRNVESKTIPKVQWKGWVTPSNGEEYFIFEGVTVFSCAYIIGNSTPNRLHTIKNIIVLTEVLNTTWATAE